MFESAELGHAIDKERYAKESPVLRKKLLDAQYALLEKGDFPVVILSGGVDGAGKGATVNLLNEWMDPRHIRTHAMGAPTDVDRAHPPMWRFWSALPPKGRTAIFFGSWYTAPIVDRTHDVTTDAELERSIEEIVRFERMLADEGVLLVKFWFHLTKKSQRKRLRELESDKRTSWRVTEQDWDNHALYDDFRRVSEHTLRMTSTVHAPWLIVEGTDSRYRDLTVGHALLQAIDRRLEEGPPGHRKRAPAIALPLDRRNVLGELDMSKAMDEEVYEDKLLVHQGKLNRHVRSRKFRDKAVLAVFEGPDAAGKGGAIRRVTRALDARHYEVIPIAAPTEEERAQPYLWRFWRHIPPKGKVTLFDRSWYGRVLVERVEELTDSVDWMRAYEEINDFEQQLVDNGIVVVKFWLAITKDEQLRRFREREETGFKKYKITADDWRNRGRWKAYERAACDMVERTSTASAPWHLVPANDKYYARIRCLKILCQQIDDAKVSDRKG